MNKRTIQLSVVATSVAVAATLALTTLLVNDEKPTQSAKGVQRGVTPETRDAAATPEAQSASMAPVESIEVIHAAATVTLPVHRDWLRSFNESMDNFALAQELVVAGNIRRRPRAARPWSGSAGVRDLQEEHRSIQARNISRSERKPILQRCHTFWSAADASCCGRCLDANGSLPRTHSQVTIFRTRRKAIGTGRTALWSPAIRSPSWNAPFDL